MLPKFLAFAGVASAFLVMPEAMPPKVKDVKDKDEENVFKALPIEMASPPDVPLVDFRIAGKSDLSVPCAECDHGDALRLQFTIQDSTHLVLNGFELFPEPDPLRTDLTAQVEGSHKEEKLGYTLGIAWGGIDEKQGMEVVDVTVKIRQVGNKIVDQVPSVKVAILMAENGMVYIVDTQVFKPAPKPKCHTLLCTLKDMIGGFKGRMGRMGCHGGKAKSALKDAANQAYGHGVPAIENAQQKTEKIINEHFKEKFHHRQSVGLLLKNVVSHVFLPVILGITAGVGVAVLAMVTANTVMVVTRCLCGRRDDEDDATEVVWYESMAATRCPGGLRVSELPNTGVKDGLLKNQSAAPEYHDDAENEKA